MSKLAKFHPGKPSFAQSTTSVEAMRSVGYCNFSGNPDDLFTELLPALGIEARSCTPDDLHGDEETWIANCIGVPPARLAAYRAKRNIVVIADQPNRKGFAEHHPTVTLPDSFARVSDGLLGHLAEREIVGAADAVLCD